MAKRWSARGGAVGLVAVLAILAVAVQGAGAVQAQLGISQYGYYTKTQDPSKTVGGQVAGVLCQLPSPDPRTCLNPSGITGGTPGWPRKDNFLYVAKLQGNPDAMGAFSIDFSALPFGAKITAGELRFQVETNPDVGTINFNPDASPAQFQFCLITQDWAAAEASPWDSQPAVDCSVRAAPRKVGTESRSETRTDSLTGQQVQRTSDLVIMAVDLLPFAAAWAKDRPNYGIAVLPVADNFEAALRTPGVSRDAMVATVSYEPPPEEPGLAGDGLTATEPQTQVFSEVSFGGGNGSVMPALPAAPFTVAQPAAARIGAGGEAPRLRAPGSSAGRIPWFVWLAFPLGLAALALVSQGLVARPVAAAERRRGPVSRLMEGRMVTRGGV